MPQIGSWVLNQACRDAAGWLRADLPIGRVAINVATSQLLGPDFLAEVERTLAATGLPGDRLEIEITEAAVLADDATTRRARSTA